MREKDSFMVIFDKFDTNFENPVGLIRDLEEVVVKEVLNEEFNVNITLPYDEDYSDKIVADNYIEILDDIFKIKTTTFERTKGSIFIKIEAEHVYFELLDDYIPEASRKTFFPHELADFLNEFSSVDITVDDYVRNNPEEFPKKRIQITRGNPIKTLSRMLKTWDLYADRFRREVKIKSRKTSNDVQLFKHQRNLTSLVREESSSHLITRLHLIGNEGLTIDGLEVSEIPYRTTLEGNIVTMFSSNNVVLGKLTAEEGLITSKYIDSKYINSFPTIRNGEIVEGVEEKVDLLVRGVEVLNEKETSNNTFELDVEELKHIYGDIERFGLGYKALIQDEILLKDEEYNLIETLITEYEYYPFNKEKTSKIKIGRLDNLIFDLFEEVEDIKQRIDEIIPEDSDDGSNQGSGAEIKLLWDENSEMISVGSLEIGIASIDVEATEDMDSQANFVVNFISDSESEVIFRIYDTNTQELYSPFISHIKRGFNSIGIPHGYKQKEEGSHEFTITMQTKVGNIQIQPRGVSFSVSVVKSEVKKLKFDLRDIALKRTKSEEKPSKVFSIGLSEENYPVVLSAPYLPNKTYGEKDFAIERDFDFVDIIEPKQILLEFNGFFELESGSELYDLYTQELPWFVWIDRSNELWAQYGDNLSTAIRLSENALYAAVAKGWTMKNENINDMGLVVAYIKNNGEVAYRQLKGLMNEVEQNSTFWTEEEILEEAGTGNKAVEVNRLNDYRMAFSTINTDPNESRILLTERNYVGQASPREYMDYNVRLDNWINLITILNVNSIPYNIIPTWSTENRKTFYLDADYKWDLRGVANNGLEIISNTSLGAIENVSIESINPKRLIVTMDKEIESGKLVVKVNPMHIIGIHDNKTRIDINEEIVVYDLFLEGKPEEKLDFQVSLEKPLIEIYQNMILRKESKETVNFQISLPEVNVEVIEVNKLKREELENVNFNVNLISIIEVYKVKDIIG